MAINGQWALIKNNGINICPLTLQLHIQGHHPLSNIQNTHSYDLQMKTALTVCWLQVLWV